MADELYTGSSTEIIPYSQDEIQEEVKKILLDKGMVDILYPGSNISKISDVMTYLIHVLNTNTAINLQEVLLPLATKRMNVLWGARQLGYEPKQRISYAYMLTLLAKKNKNFGQNPGESGYETEFIIQLPKYTKFLSGPNTYYTYAERNNIRISNKMIDDNDPMTSIRIIAKEGTLTKFADNDLLRFRAFNIINDEGDIEVKQSYIVPFDNVEEKGLEVFLTYIDENNVEHIREKWEQSTYFLIDSAYDQEKLKYTKMQNIFTNMPEIFFEVGGIGPRIRLNTLIEINLLQSSGREGEAADSFSIEDTELQETWGVQSFYEIEKGKNVESEKSIKENAAIFHNSANRAITALDYVALVQKHEKVAKATCWGAEDESGRGKGWVYLSMLPDRTIKTYLSVIDTETDGNDDNDPTNDNNYDRGNNYFVLQQLPRHPYNQYVGEFWMGSDDWNGSPPDLYPDKAEFVEGAYWTIDFDDTNNDGTMDIHGGDLDGVTVSKGDILLLGAGKVFEHHVADETIYPTDRTTKGALMNWYLDEFLDIQKRDYDFDTDTMERNIFSYLEPYQMISITTFFRQPVYCDFDIKIYFIQNNIAVSQREINYEVFKIIESFFNNEMDGFEKQFLLSNLVSKITEFTPNIDGLNIDFDTKLTLHKTMYDQKLSKYDNNQKTIYCSLGFPFERIYDINTFELITTFLPQISSLSAAAPLFVDFDAFWVEDGTDIPTKGHAIIAAPIHLGTDNTGDIVGYYIIRNDYQLDIEIELYFSDDGTIKTTYSPGLSNFLDFATAGKELQANIKEEDFFIDSDYGYLQLVYPGVESVDWQNITKGKNLPFTRYTTPRLNSVKYLRRK